MGVEEVKNKLVGSSVIDVHGGLCGGGGGGGRICENFV